MKKRLRYSGQHYVRADWGLRQSIEINGTQGMLERSWWEPGTVDYI